MDDNALREQAIRELAIEELNAEQAGASSIPGASGMDVASLTNSYDMPPSTDQGVPISLFDSPPQSPFAGTIQNPPVLNSPEVIGAKAQKAFPVVAETAANVAGLAVPGGPFVKGLAGVALEQGMNHLLQNTGVKEDTPWTQDAIDAGISSAFNMIPAAGEAMAGPYSRKLAAAKGEYALAEGLFQPISQSKMGRAYASQLKKVQGYVLDSGILKGATEFDSATGKFIAPKAGAPKDLQSLRGNIENLLNGNQLKGTPGLISERDAILDRIDQATQVYNQGQAAGKQIQGIKASDFDQAMKPLQEKIAKLGATPGVTGDIASGINDELSAVMSDVASFKGSVPVTGSSGGSRVYGNLSPKDANTVISNIYEKARRLEAFSNDVADPLMKQQWKDGANVLLESAEKLRGLRDGQITKVLNTLQSSGGLSDITATQVQNINDAVHNLLTFRDAGLTPAIDAIVPKAGARAMLSSEADNVAKPSFNQTGVLQTALDKLKAPFGFGPETVSTRLSEKAMNRLGVVQGYNDPHIPSSLFMAGRTLGSPAGQAASVYANMARKENAPNALAQVVASQGLEHGVDAPAPVPIQMPRSAGGVDLNEMQYVLTLKILGEQGIINPDQASTGVDLMGLPPEVQPQIQEATQIAGGIVARMENVLKFGTKDDANAELSSVAKQFPDAFPPPKTGVQGEIEVNGKPHLVLPEDRMVYSKTVKESSLSNIEKAKVLSELNRTGKVIKVVK